MVLLALLLIRCSGCSSGNDLEGTVTHLFFRTRLSSHACAVYTAGCFQREDMSRRSGCAQRDLGTLCYAFLLCRELGTDLGTSGHAFLPHRELRTVLGVRDALQATLGRHRHPSLLSDRTLFVRVRCVYGRMFPTKDMSRRSGCSSGYEDRQFVNRLAFVRTSLVRVMEFPCHTPRLPQRILSTLLMVLAFFPTILRVRWGVRPEAELATC